MPDFTLYWTSLSNYESCPQMFLWNRGWGTIDVGGGPGKKKPKPYQKSEHHAVMGTVIQAVIERFYNDELWKLLKPEPLKKRLLELADENFRLESAKRFIDWRIAGAQEDMAKVIKEGVMGYMRTLKAHKLLGPYAKAEVELLAYVDKYNPIGGRADVIFRRDDNGTTILDGKNSRRYKDGKGGMMTYTDPDQLRWYALCYYLAYRQRPERLGFVYYRYPYGTPILDAEGKETGDIEQGVDWVTYQEEDLKGLAQRALTARKGMDKEMFDARPDYKTCRFCDYESVCPERQAKKEQNRRAPKTTDDVLNGISGVMSFNMGDEKG